jgi:hypothetical protein
MSTKLAGISSDWRAKMGQIASKTKQLEMERELIAERLTRFQPFADVCVCLSLSFSRYLSTA